MHFTTQSRNRLLVVEAGDCLEMLRHASWNSLMVEHNPERFERLAALERLAESRFLRRLAADHV